jgi:hypothetical protein
MLSTDTSEIATILQTAVSPVVLISGVGLLLLIMTNRLARIVDRARSLTPRLAGATDEEARSVHAQLRSLARRARLVRRSIASAGVSALFAALIIVILFVSSLAGVEIPWVLAALFIISLLLLIFSLVDFIRDVHHTLETTALEVGKDWEK